MNRRTKNNNDIFLLNMEITSSAKIDCRSLRNLKIAATKTKSDNSFFQAVLWHAWAYGAFDLTLTLVYYK